MILNQVFMFGLVIFIMMAGLDIMLFQANWWGRGFTRSSLNWLIRQIRAGLRWIWRNYRRELIGFVLGVMTTLYVLSQNPPLQ